MPLGRTLSRDLNKTGENTSFIDMSQTIKTPSSTHGHSHGPDAARSVAISQSTGTKSH